MPWSRAKLRTEDTAISVVILMQQTAYYIDGLLKVRRVLLGSQHVHEVRHRQAKGWLLGQDSNLESVSRRINSRFQFAVESTPGPGYFSVPVHGALPHSESETPPGAQAAMGPGDASYAGCRDIPDHCAVTDGGVHHRTAQRTASHRKLTRLNCSNTSTSYAVFRLQELEPGTR